MTLTASHPPFRSRMRHFLCAAAFLLALSPQAAWSEDPVEPVEPAPHAPVESGHSAMWFYPERSGEGWSLEILPDDGAVLYWFTFDDEGQPRWLVGAGNVVRDGEDGDSIVFPELVAAHGARFGPDFDPDDVIREVQGQATITFADCNDGRIDFDAYGKTGSYPITRLTRTMAAGCGPIHGTPGEVVQPHAGQSGSWFDPATSGQGFTLQWLADGTAVLVWFTFDPEGNPYWLTGTGHIEDDRLVMPVLYSASGGRFAEPFDPADIIRTPWGGLELALECDTGEADYLPIEPGFSSGSFQLHRLTRLEKPACPWVKPKLTDLYDLEWTELPIPAYLTPLNPIHFEMSSIADDGTVVGRGTWDGWAGIVRLRPGETEWEKMLEDGGFELFITPDGETIYGSRNVPSSPEDATREWYRQVMMWREATGWQPLPGTIYVSNALNGMSQNGKWLTGHGYLPNDGRAYPWKWSEETGQIPMEEGPTPLGISNDGDIAVGTVALFTRRAAMWINDAMQFLFDSDNGDVHLGIARACDADCSLVAGFYQHPVDMANPATYRAWYRRRSGAVTYLDIPEGAIDNNVVAMNSEGSLIAGNQAVWEESRSRLILEGWLWTQDTGSVSLRDILEGEGEFQFTDRWYREVMDVSSDGTKILFSGWTLVPNGQLTQYRAGVLRLVPRASEDALHQP